MRPDVRDLLSEIAETLQRLETLNAQLRESVLDEGDPAEGEDADKVLPSAQAGRLKALTPREHQVLELILAGATNRSAGETLKISPRTVEVYRARIMEKLKVRNTVELVRAVLAERDAGETDEAAPDQPIAAAGGSRSGS